MATEDSVDPEVSARPQVSLVVICADVMRGGYRCIVTTSCATVTPVLHKSRAWQWTTLSWCKRVCIQILACIWSVDMRCSNDTPFRECHNNVLPVTDSNC